MAVPPPPLTPYLAGGAGAPRCDPTPGLAWDPLMPQGKCVLSSCCPAICLVVWSGGARRRAERQGIRDELQGPLQTCVEPGGLGKAGRPVVRHREGLPALGRARPGQPSDAHPGAARSVSVPTTYTADLLLKRTAALSAWRFHREGGWGRFAAGFTPGLKQRWGRRAPPGFRAQETGPQQEAQQRGDHSGGPDPGPWGSSLPHQPSPQDPTSLYPRERTGRLSAIFQMGKLRLRTARSRA